MIIGDNCHIYAGCVITHTHMGNSVIIHSNTVVGSAGFGFVPNKNGHIDFAQTGMVVIGNDVRIGNGCVVNRGAEGETIINDGCRLDSHILIAHNVKIGKSCILAGESAIVGCVVVGDYVMLAGKASIGTNDVSIGDGAILSGCSVVIKNVPAGQQYSGFPARPHKEWLKSLVKEKG